MPHIQLPAALPGITGPLAFRPETAAPLMTLADTLLRGPSPLTAAERELIAAYVSALNECNFCRRSHAAAARRLFGADAAVVEAAIADPTTPLVSAKMRALLAIAAKVQRDGRLVTGEDVAAARAAGADDVEIHDTVLVAAAFCMFNRYVEGLGTWAPEDEAAYDAMGARMAANGYGRR